MIVVSVMLGLLNDKSYLRKIISMSIITHDSTVTHPIDVIDNYDDDDNDEITYHLPRTFFCCSCHTLDNVGDIEG